jgi:SMI1-KNR4 cell-wall
LDSAELALGVALPGELREFLAATDGFYDAESRHECAWTLQRIIRENANAWSDARMAFERDLLAFGDDGAGDWFCMPVRSSARSDDVVHWTWIGQDRRTIAPSLRDFWMGWYDGSIQVAITARLETVGRTSACAPRQHGRR